jgi:hypothetical protein
MSKQILAATVTLLLAASGAAFAGDIYKWVDADGNVHYGDRPVGEQAERMAIDSSPTDQSAVQERYQTKMQARVEQHDADREAADEAAKAEEEMRAEAEQRRKKCEASRATMERFVRSRRLYREDENGERVYLDEAETLAARQRVENQVSEYCNP